MIVFDKWYLFKFETDQKITFSAQTNINKKMFLIKYKT